MKSAMIGVLCLSVGVGIPALGPDVVVGAKSWWNAPSHYSATDFSYYKQCPVCSLIVCNSNSERDLCTVCGSRGLKHVRARKLRCGMRASSGYQLYDGTLIFRPGRTFHQHFTIEGSDRVYDVEEVVRSGEHDFRQ